jgi:hypothetical protein
MTLEERAEARGAHVEAVAAAERVSVAVAHATATHHSALADQSKLVEKAAAGSILPAAKIVDAAREVSIAASTPFLETAGSVLAVARTRATATAVLVQEADEADRQDHLADAFRRSLATGADYDEAIAEFDGAFQL